MWMRAYHSCGLAARMSFYPAVLNILLAPYLLTFLGLGGVVNLHEVHCIIDSAFESATSGDIPCALLAIGQPGYGR